MQCDEDEFFILLSQTTEVGSIFERETTETNSSEYSLLTQECPVEYATSYSAQIARVKLLPIDNSVSEGTRNPPPKNAPLLPSSPSLTGTGNR